MEKRFKTGEQHAQRGTSLQGLQQLGGWESFEMVLRYAHLSSDHLKGEAEIISVAKMDGREVTKCDSRLNLII